MQRRIACLYNYKRIHATAITDRTRKKEGDIRRDGRQREIQRERETEKKIVCFLFVWPRGFGELNSPAKPCRPRRWKQPSATSRTSTRPWPVATMSSRYFELRLSSSSGSSTRSAAHGAAPVAHSVTHTHSAPNGVTRVAHGAAEPGGPTLEASRLAATGSPPNSPASRWASSTTSCSRWRSISRRSATT